MELEKKLIDLQLLHCADYEKIWIQADYIKFRHISTILELERKNEPSKIFKKKYKEWKEEIERLEKELSDAKRKIDDDFSSLEKIYTTLKG